MVRRRLGSALAVWLALLTLCSTAFGAEPQPQLRRPVLDSPEYAPLKATWLEVQSDLDRRAWTEAAGHLPRLTEIRSNLGLPNVFPLSAALLHAASQASEDEATDAAAALAAAAAALSPDLAAAKFEEATVAWEMAPFGVADQLKALRGALERLSNDMQGSLALLANTLSAVTYILVMLLVALGLALVIRYRTLAANDLRRLLPRGVNRLQASLALATLLVAPFLAGLGLLATAVLWLVATSFYHRTSERVATIGLLLLLGGLPTATTYLVRAMTAPASPSAVFHRCAASLCAQDDRQTLQRWAAGDELRYPAAFTLALVEKRIEASGRGEYSAARRFQTLAIKEEDTPEAQVLAGNLSYLEALGHCDGLIAGRAAAKADFEAKLTQATTHYESALEAHPNHLVALYNVSVVLRQLDRREEAESRLAAAAEQDPKLVARWNAEVAKELHQGRCSQPALGNRHLMDPSLPMGRLTEPIMSQDVPTDGVVMPFAGLFTGRFGTLLVGIVGFIGAFLVGLIWLLGGTLRTTRFCKKCRGVADPDSRLDLKTESVCEECLRADFNRGMVDAKDQWVRDQKVQGELARRAKVPRWLTWILPGFGHLLRGAPVRGLIFMALVFGSMLVGLGLHVVIHDTRQPLGVGGARIFYFTVIAGITYLLALIDAHTSKTIP